MITDSILQDSVFWNNLIRFAYTMIMIFIISYFFYYRRNGRSDYLFTYLLVGAIVFQICLLLKSISFNIGFALGLFAVFAIIRYRTSPVFPREMTYLFVIVGVAALDGLVDPDYKLIKMVIWDLSVIAMVALGEYLLNHKRLRTKRVRYERIEMLEEGMEEKLKADLQKRLGIRKIEKIKIGYVDFLRDTVNLLVYFRDTRDNNFEDN